MPSFASASRIRDFLTSAATSTVEYLEIPAICRTSWAGQKHEQAPENNWIAIIRSEDRADALPLRQAFVRYTQQGKLEAGIMAVIEEQLLPLDAFQHEVRAACPDIFRMIVKRRQGKQTAEAWSLTWCEPSIAPSASGGDINDWLALSTSLTNEKIKCISVSREFEAEAIDQDNLAVEIRKTLVRLSKLLEIHAQQHPPEKPTQLDTALISVLSALQINTLKQVDLDALIDELSQTFNAHCDRKIVARGHVSNLSTEDVWIEFVLPGYCDHGTALLHAGILLTGAQDQIKLVLEQGHQYAVKKFGGRTAVAKMHEARKRSLAAMSRLVEHGFVVEQQTLDVAESSLEKVRNTQLTACRVFIAADMKNDQMLISALTEMIKVYTDLCDLPVV
jgi:hypothetical protein